MKTCPSCGNSLEDDVKFCDKCGANVGGEQAATGETPVMQQSIPQPQPMPEYNAQANSAPNFDPTDHTSEFTAEDISNNKVLALCPYILGWIGVIIALIASKESPYVAFHVRQGLKIAVCQVLLAYINVIPFLGWGLCAIGEVVLAVVMLIAFFSTCKGNAKEVAIIKNFGFLK